MLGETVVPRRRIPMDLGALLLHELLMFDRAAQRGLFKAREKLLRRLREPVTPGLFDLVDGEVLDKGRSTRFYHELYAYDTHI